METKTFNLLSGPECEVRRLLTEHQDILFPDSQSGSVSMAKNINRILSETIIRIGSDEKITKEKCANLLSGDRKQILFEMGRFACESLAKVDDSILETDENIKKYDPSFGEGQNPNIIKFTYKFRDGKQEIESDYEEEIIFKRKDYPFQFDEYEDVRENIVFECVLPYSKKKVQYTLIDGNVEARWEKKHKTINSFIDMYSPMEINEDLSDKEKEKKNFKKSLLVGKLEIVDSSYLREHIMMNIGYVESTILVDHPYIDGKYDKVDVMTLPEFFFPKAGLKTSAKYGEN